MQYIMSDLAGQQTRVAATLPLTIIILLMHSAHLLSPEHLTRCFPHQELAFSDPGRLYHLSSQVPRGPQVLSDVDLQGEQHHPPPLFQPELRQNSPLHVANNPSPALPIPMSSASSTTPSSSVLASPAAMFLAAFSPSSKPAPPPDAEGQTVAGYTLGGIIGYGGFSTIRRGFSASGGIVAVKIVRKSDIQKQQNPGLVQKKLVHEAQIWSSLSHEHILPLFSAVHTSYADFFVTLLCPAGSLYDILQRDGTPALPQDDAGMMLRQVVRGLRYLHEVAMYVHRDIKLENVLVDEMGVCRISDFGMSRKIGETDEDERGSDVEEHNNVAAHRSATISGSARRSGRSSLQSRPLLARSPASRHRHSTSSAHPTHLSQPGSLPYASPEILLPNTHPHPAQDMWALGVLLYALLTGRFPFCDSFEPRLQMKILHGKGQFIITNPYSNKPHVQARLNFQQVSAEVPSAFSRAVWSALCSSAGLLPWSMKLPGTLAGAMSLQLTPTTSMRLTASPLVLVLVRLCSRKVCRVKTQDLGLSVRPPLADQLLALSALCRGRLFQHIISPILVVLPSSPVAILASPRLHLRTLSCRTLSLPSFHLQRHLLTVAVGPYVALCLSLLVLQVRVSYQALPVTSAWEHLVHSIRLRQ